MVDKVECQNAAKLEIPEFEGLTHLQVKFIECYVADPKRNGTKAVKNAGYQVKSDNAASVQAHENLRNPRITKAIRAIEQQFGGPSDFELVTNRLLAIATTSITDVMTWDSEGRAKLIPSNKLSYQASLAIASVQDARDDGQMALPGMEKEGNAAVSTNTKRCGSVKMHDPIRAAEALSKILGWNAPDRFEGQMSGRMTIEIVEQSEADPLGQ